jgi:hypothetical protein
MREAGDVGFSDVKPDRDGTNVGYVEYGTREELERALTRLDRSMFKCVARVGRGGGDGGGL